MPVQGDFFVLIGNGAVHFEQEFGAIDGKSTHPTAGCIYTATLLIDDANPTRLNRVKQAINFSQFLLINAAVCQDELRQPSILPLTDISSCHELVNQ